MPLLAILSAIWQFLHRSTPIYRKTVFQVSDLVVGLLPGGSNTISSITVVGCGFPYDVKWVVSNPLISYKLGVYRISSHYAFSFSSSILLCFWLCDSNSLFIFLLSFVISMADHLRHAIQDLNLGIDDEPIALPSLVCSAARRANQFVLIGRPLVPRRQNCRAIVASIPRIWGLNNIITGRLVEQRRFQFIFPSEELLQSVVSGYE